MSETASTLPPPPEPDALDSHKLDWLIGAIRHVADVQLEMRQELHLLHEDVRAESRELGEQKLVLTGTAGRVQELHDRLVEGEKSISELQEAEEGRREREARPRASDRAGGG